MAERVNYYSGYQIKEILTQGKASVSWVVLPDGSKIPVEECRIVVSFVEESAHLVNLLTEGNIKLDLHQEYDRKRAVLARLSHPYFSLPGFPRLCRHGPVAEGTVCKACEKDKADALRRLGD